MAFLHKLSNYLALEAQRVLGFERVAGMPYYVVLDPTSRCQLGCPFCGRSSRPLATMSFAEFQPIIDRIGKTCVALELYDWGEPFLNKEILQMIRYASGRYGIHTRISSNLNVRNDALYRDLVTSGLSALTISIDGASQETYERYRVNGSFDVVIENIKLLVARKRELSRVEPKLVWQFLVFRHNEHEIGQAQRMARELGVDEIVFRKPNLPAEFRDWGSSLPAFSHAGAAEHRPPGDSPAAPRDPGPPVPAGAEQRCTWPYSSVAINANGAVSPCCGVAEPAEDFGSVRDADFAEVWNNREFRMARRHVKQHVVAPTSDNTCGRCSFKGAINQAPGFAQLMYYSVGPLRRLWIRWRGFRIKPALPHRRSPSRERELAPVGVGAVLRRARARAQAKPVPVPEP